MPCWPRTTAAADDDGSSDTTAPSDDGTAGGNSGDTQHGETQLVAAGSDDAPDQDGSDQGSSDQGGSDQGGTDSTDSSSQESDSGAGGSISGIGGVIDTYLQRILALTPEEREELGIRTVGDLDGNDNLVVEGEVLKGTGLVSGDLVVDGGTVAPGNSPGTQTTNNLVFNDGTLQIEIAGLGAGEFDLIQVIKDLVDPDNTGFATFVDGIVRFVFLDYFAPQAGDSITFLTAESGIIGWENMVLEIGALADGFAFHVVNDGNSLTFVADSDAIFVPEPGTLTLLLAGAGGLLILRRRRRKAA